MAKRTAMIRTKGLTKAYGDFEAVRGLDLRVDEGEIFGLLGPNGAGKTTTILMLLGLSEPTAGAARVAGIDPTADPIGVKRVVGYLPDNVGFYDDLTGRQNLRYTADLNGIRGSEAEDRMDEILDTVGLTYAADNKARTYSRGMRQRLGLADALLKRPKVLILDEPTIGIDPEGVHDMLVLIDTLRRTKKMTVLLSSHQLPQVQRVCDRVGIFVAGELVAQGPVDTLGTQILGGAAIATEVGTEPVDDEAGTVLRGVDGVQIVERSDMGRWIVTSDHDLAADIAAALGAAGYSLTHLARRRHDLDEIYRVYFQEGSGALEGARR